MRDRDIRPEVRKRAADASPGALVLDEVGLMYGAVIVDVMALTPDCLHGYEIKADADNLTRLPMQVDLYSQTLDRCTLVVGGKHVAKASALVPPWWGIQVATVTPSGALPFATVSIEEVRPAVPNPAPAVHAMLHLLWRPELVMLLDEAGALKGARSASKGRLFTRVLEVFPSDVLWPRVRKTLCDRVDWRRPAVASGAER